jgi:hypothetical protein
MSTFHAITVVPPAGPDALARKLAALKRDRAEALADVRRAQAVLAEASRRVEDILDEIAAVRAALQRRRERVAGHPMPAVQVQQAVVLPAA